MTYNVFGGTLNLAQSNPSWVTTCLEMLELSGNFTAVMEVSGH